MADDKLRALGEERVRDFLKLTRVARLATSDHSGVPHNIPICFWIDAVPHFYFVIDEEGADESWNFELCGPTEWVAQFWLRLSSPPAQAPDRQRAQADAQHRGESARRTHHRPLRGRMVLPCLHPDSRTGARGR